jgi:SAM-dependent methyltransferase
MRQFLKHHLSKDFRAMLLKVERMIRLLANPGVFSALFSFDALKAEANDDRFTTNIVDVFPISGDNTKYTSFDRHYVYHTSWAARVVSELASDAKRAGQDDFFHIDISSSLYFCGLVSAFVPVRFYDYRPADLRLNGLETAPGDLMKLPFADGTVESISCMHTIEHVGLGRYGDPLDPLGDRKALDELMRVVKPGGSLILVVPVGRQRIEFNAHRIYSPANFASYVMGEKNPAETSSTFSLKEYAYIPETDADGPMERNADVNDPKKGANDRYACGCFWFVRD